MAKQKTKQFYPFTEYSPKTERRLKKLFFLGERGTLRRVIQDGIIVSILRSPFLPLAFFASKDITAKTLTDKEVNKLMPHATIIKRGRGGVTVAVNPSAPKLPTVRRTMRITPKTPRLKR